MRCVFFGCWSCHDSCWECVPGLVEFFGGLRISWNNCELVRADLSCLLVFGKALNQISLRFLASAMVKHYNQLWLLHFLGPGAHHKPFFPSNMSSTLTTSWSLYLNKILGQKLGDSKAPHSSHNMMQENAPNPMASSLVRMFQTQAHNQQPMQRSMFQGCSPANPQREFMLCQGSSFVKHGALLDESKKRNWFNKLSEAWDCTTECHYTTWKVDGATPMYWFIIALY